MAVYIDENFNSTPLGPTNNPGSPPWSLQFGSGIVYAYNQNGGGPNFVDNWYQFGSGQFYSPIGSWSGTLQKVSLWWGFKIGLGAIGMGAATISALNSTLTGLVTLIQVRSEVNNSLSFVDGAGNILQNTSNPPIGVPTNPGYIYQQGIWSYVQLNLEIKQDITGTFVEVTVTCAINGTIIAQFDKVTGVLLSSLFSLGVYQVLFGSNVGFYSIADIVLEDEVPVNTYPHPGTPLHDRIAQMVMEPAYLPAAEANVDIAQMVIEQSYFPAVPANVDIAQMVIEIAYIARSVRGRFPEYIHRRNMVGL